MRYVPLFALLFTATSGLIMEDLTPENKTPLAVTNSIAGLCSGFGLKAGEFVIVVVPATQELYLVQNQRIVRTYPVSTSKNGIGNVAGSEKTPPGTHRIKAKIGAKAVLGTIFVGRVDTGKIATIFSDETDIPEDLVTTRIMWLEGQEAGVNRGEGIDSYARYIYIHGTPEEGLIGTPQSHGCIRMKNADVVELFDLVPEGTLVEIWVDGKGN